MSTIPKGINEKDYQLLVSVLGEGAAKAVVESTTKAGEILEKSGVQFKSVLLQEKETIPAEPVAAKASDIDEITRKVLQDSAAVVSGASALMEKMTTSMQEVTNERDVLAETVKQLATKVDRFMLMTMQALSLKTRASYSDESALDLALLKMVNDQVDSETKQQHEYQNPDNQPLITKMMSVGGAMSGAVTPNMGIDPLAGTSGHKHGNGNTPKKGEL